MSRVNTLRKKMKGSTKKVVIKMSHTDYEILVKLAEEAGVEVVEYVKKRLDHWVEVVEYVKKRLDHHS